MHMECKYIFSKIILINILFVSLLYIRLLNDYWYNENIDQERIYLQGLLSATLMIELSFD